MDDLEARIVATLLNIGRRYSLSFTLVHTQALTLRGNRDFAKR